MERFRDTYYLVTTCGKVWSEKSKKFLKPYKNGKDGYYRVSLNIGGKRYTMLLHRVVAECYLPNINKYPVVNHRDCDKSHCWKGNLEWSTTSHNNKHAIDNGLHRKLSDGLNGMSKKIECFEGDKWVEYPSSATLARKLGVHRSSVTLALRGKQSAICGFKVRYK